MKGSRRRQGRTSFFAKKEAKKLLLIFDRAGGTSSGPD
jgi:hypothetical protein